jgi:hypothetical protein
MRFDPSFCIKQGPKESRYSRLITIHHTRWNLFMGSTLSKHMPLLSEKLVE